MVKIGTHNGTFHCDEALAVYILKQLNEYKDAELIRTRDPQELEKCDVVVDVGGVYDHNTHRYDHHQREFNETFSEKHHIRLSSAGLIYKHFGPQLIANKTGWEITDPRVDVLYNKVYVDFIQALDAIDNGVSRYETELKPRYTDHTNLASRVGNLNPWWNQTGIDMMERFVKASNLAGGELDDRIDYLAHSWMPAREVVENALKKRHDVHPSGQILYLEQFCNWKDHLHNLEVELAIDTEILYVLYKDESGKFRVQAVSIAPDSFVSRLPLPEEWRGIRDQQLSELSKIPGCVFVHASGFIGGNESYEGALSMASQSIADTYSSKKPKLAE